MMASNDSNPSARRAEANNAIKRLMDLGARIAPLSERLDEFPDTQSLTDIMLDDTLPPEVAETVRDIFHNKQAFKELQAVAGNDIASIVKYIQEQDATIAQLQQANKLVVDPDALAQQCQQAVIAALTAETGPLGNNFNTRIREIHRATTHDDGVLHQVHQTLVRPANATAPTTGVLSRVENTPTGRYTSRLDNPALRAQPRTTPVSIPLLDRPRTETPNVPSNELTGVSTSPAAALATTPATNPPARQGLRSSASTSRLPVPVGTLTPATPTPVRAPSGEFTFATPPTGATYRAQSEKEKQNLRDILGVTVDRSLSKQPLDFLLELDVRVGDGTSNVEGFTPLPGGLSEGTIKRLVSELGKELCVLSGVKWPQVEAGVTKSTCLYFKLKSKGTSDGLFVACETCKTRNRFCIRKAKLGKNGFAVYLAPLSTTDRPSIINSQENIEMSYWVLEPEKGANGWD